MNNESTLCEIIKMIEKNDEPIYFSTPIMVKKTPHQFLACIWGIVKFNDKQLSLMTDEGKWLEVAASQVNADYILNSIYQRLRLLTHTYVAKQDFEVNAMIVQHG